MESRGNENRERRRTGFESRQEELGHHAKSLLQLARDKYGRADVTVSDALDLATREDDDIEGLRRAIAIEIKGEPEAMLEGKTSTTAATSTVELSPEQAWLNAFKTRFDALPDLHKGIEWSEVEKSLQADPESMGKLQLLDEKGHEMNVFRAKNDGEIQFRTAQTDVTKIAPEHRTIMYDKKAQTDYPRYGVNGNAEDIAASMGVELADKELYEQFRVKNGWVWLKTDAATRKAGAAFYGSNSGIHGNYAYNRAVYCSFCAALRVKKA